MEFSSIDTLWILLCTVLVFLMQAGFTLLEVGLTRKKNAGNIVMKNIMDFSIGTMVFWIFGFGLMFATGNAWFGELDFLTQGDYSGTYPTSTFIIFQTVYCASAATIVSGAVAERTKFSTYLVLSAILSGIIYPISGHWIWGGGWLAELGFHDFAGSTVIHMVGGAAALVGAKIVGPRIGKFGPDGKARAIPGQSLTLAALGMFILWWAWFGFNAGSSLTMSGDGILYTSDIFVTTNLAAAVASIVTMTISWIRYGRPDISLTISGALGGLVAITAGCDVVTPVGSVIIGFVAGFIIIFAVELMDNILKIDDPVGAVAVHGFCGAFGTIAVGLFDKNDGVLYGGDMSYLLIQIMGVAAVLAYVLVVMTIVFTILKNTLGLRVSEEEEIVGLDIKEHGLISELTDMTPSIIGANFKAKEAPAAAVVPADVAVPVNYEVTNIDAPIKKVVIITKQTKFEALKHALDKLEITGMTVTQVLGCGIQKGAPEYYRGAPIEATLLPKVKVEIVISKVPVATLVGAAKEALYSGHIGDGKIFIYDVENVVKVRTGEEGYDALQGE